MFIKKLPANGGILVVSHFEFATDARRNIKKRLSSVTP
jgi:hypothetical protein